MKFDVEYINFIMTEVNKTSDNIYESMFEENNDREVIKYINTMIEHLEDIKAAISQSKI